MKSYGQFCSIARALDLLGERWTLLVVRELLGGTTRFNNLRRGIPRISRTMLSARLRELLDAGVVTRETGVDGPTYTLTPAGLELASTVGALGTWGQRWLPRSLSRHELDLDALLWDIQRRIRSDLLPALPLVARLEISGTPSGTAERFLLLRREEISLCTHNPGFPEELRIIASLQTLTAWWRGDVSFAEARSAGLRVEGRRAWVRAFPTWFQRYAFAAIPPAPGRAPVRISYPSGARAGRKPSP